MLPIKLVKPGVLEIKGNFSHSPHFYLPVLSIRSFVVHKQPSCIELHMRSLTPGGATVLKNVDCRPELMTQTVDFLSECISTTSPNNTTQLLEELHRRIVALESVSGTVNPAHQALEEFTMFLREMVDRSDRLQQERRLNEEIYSEGSLTQGEGTTEAAAEDAAEDTTEGTTEEAAPEVVQKEDDDVSVVSDLSEPLEVPDAFTEPEAPEVTEAPTEEPNSLLYEYKEDILLSMLIAFLLGYTLFTSDIVSSFPYYTSYP